MSMHNVIVVSGDPKGHFIEGVLKEGQSVYPGHLVQIDASLPLIDQRPQYKLWDGAQDGERSEIVVVRENDLLGGTVDTVYPDGSRFFGYIPVKGDEIQVRFLNIGTGTGAGQEDITVGDKMIADKGTGNVIVTTGSPEDEPFTALETITDIVENERVLVRRN